MRHVKTRLTRTPTLVLDVRDWFATTFGIGPKPARPPGELAVTAEPVDPATPWPVRGALELVAVRTPAGMLGVFDRVRAPGGPLLRFRLAAGAYRLRVADPPKSYPMYQPFDVPNPVLVPEPGLPATVVPNVELLPGALYPFTTVRPGKPGPTLAWGAVRAADGSGREGVRVRAVNRPDSPECRTDAAGRWAVVLDPLPGNPFPAGPLALSFRFPDGSVVLVGGLAVTPGQVLAVHQASLIGEARIDGRAVAGVRVTADVAPGEATSGPDGRWQFVFPLMPPADVPPDAVVTGTAPDGRTATRPARPRPGAATPVDPLTF